MSLIATNTLVCLGSSVSITASSSSNNYLWNFGSTNATEVVTPATNTTYSVTSTLNGCSTTESITISVFTQTLSVSASTAICKGATITLNASGGTTYQWSDGQSGSTVSVSPTTNTVYVVSATTQTNNMTCASSGTVNVTVNPNPTVTAVLTKTLICKGETTTITANGATNYAWNTGATTASFSVSPTINTNYTVTGMDANNCSNTATVQLRVQTCAGIAQVNGLENYELSIYPNPSNGAFTIKSDVAINLTLINELGQTVKTISLTEANKQEVNISELANGIYFVVGKTDSVKVNQKIVVAK
jgi:hypothetical protein